MGTYVLHEHAFPCQDRMDPRFLGCAKARYVSTMATKGGDTMTTPPRDWALLVLAVVLMLGGAVVLVGGWVSAGIAIPLIAIGIALVVLEKSDVRRQHGKRVPGT